MKDNNKIPGAYDLGFPCDHQWEPEGRVLESGKLFKCERCNGMVEEYIRNWKKGENLIKHPLLEGKEFPEEINNMNWDWLEISVGDYVFTKDGKIVRISGDDMPDLKYEDIIRHATESEIIEEREMTQEEYLAESTTLDILAVIEGNESDIKKIKTIQNIIKDFKKIKEDDKI